MSDWMCVDRDGWPVTTIRGHRFVSLLRLLIHTRAIVRAAACCHCGERIPATLKHNCGGSSNVAGMKAVPSVEAGEGDKT